MSGTATPALTSRLLDAPQPVGISFALMVVTVASSKAIHPFGISWLDPSLSLLDTEVIKKVVLCLGFRVPDLKLHLTWKVFLYV